MESGNIKSSGINWLAVFIEAFLVVLGVLLALAANNWRDEHNQRQRAEVAMQSILEELDLNRLALGDAIVYHTGLMDTLYGHMRAYGIAAANKPGIDVFQKGFVHPAQPLSRAWEAANATGLVESMPYEDVLLISNVYKHQEQYEVLSRTFGQQIYSRMFDGGTESILDNYQNLAQIIGSFAYTECNLADEYIEVLSGLKEDSTQLARPIYCNYLPSQ